jgi:hypothetical protein
MNFRRILILLIIFQFFGILFANEIKNKKIVIIYNQTKFKKQVVPKLEKKLLELNFIVTKDFLNKLYNYNPNDYDVVVIMSGIAAFTPYPVATNYIRKYDYKDNIVYYCAAFTSSLIYGFLEKKRLDAVTSASKTDNVDMTVNLIMEKILKVANRIP